MPIIVCFFEWFAQQTCFPSGGCTQPSREEVLVLSCSRSNMSERSARGIPPPPLVLLLLLLLLVRSRLSRLSYLPLTLLLFLPLGLLPLPSLLPLLLFLLSAPRVFLPLHRLLLGRLLPLVLLLLPFMLLVLLCATFLRMFLLLVFLGFHLHLLLVLLLLVCSFFFVPLASYPSVLSPSPIFPHDLPPLPYPLIPVQRSGPVSG